MYWGYHLILDCSKCIPKRIRDKRTIERFSKTLVTRIDMVPFGEPRVEHFGEGNKAGYTLVQLIETSNIVAHFVEQTDDMYLDVFSCKPFSPNDVVSTVNLYFSPSHINRTYLTRQALQENGRFPSLDELK
jgi:S-adenosylmethionine/arginine decarboxylase-like enzyme